jgi:hypothetical protein
MEAIRSYETSIHTRSTRPHIPEDGILHFGRSSNACNPCDLLIHSLRKGKFLLAASASRLRWNNAVDFGCALDRSVNDSCVSIRVG